MKKISFLILSVILLTLTSCGDDVSKENQTEVEAKKTVGSIEKIKVREAEIKEMGEVDKKDGNRFMNVDNLDGVIALYDTQEKLFWDTVTSPEPIEWSTAKKWIEPSYTNDGYVFAVGQSLLKSPAFKYCLEKGNQWRLPTKGELNTLIYQKISDDEVKTSELSSINQDLYWTSEQIESDNTSWIADFSEGIMRESKSDEEVYALCVHSDIDLTGGISDEEFEKENIQPKKQQTDDEKQKDLEIKSINEEEDTNIQEVEDDSVVKIDKISEETIKIEKINEIEDSENTQKESIEEVVEIEKIVDEPVKIKKVVEDIVKIEKITE